MKHYIKYLLIISLFASFSVNAALHFVCTVDYGYGQYPDTGMWQNDSGVLCLGQTTKTCYPNSSYNVSQCLSSYYLQPDGITYQHTCISPNIETAPHVCSSPPPAECPAGQTGTPPNCVPQTCPSGQFGIFPNCYNYCENIDVNNPPSSCVPRSSGCDPQYFEDGGVCTLVPNCNHPNSGGYVENQYFDVQSKTCKTGTNPDSTNCYILDTIHLVKYGVGTSPYPSPRYYCPPFAGCIPEDVNCHNYPTSAELDQVGLGIDGTNHAGIQTKLDDMKVKADDMLVKAADELQRKYQDKINNEQIVQVDLTNFNAVQAKQPPASSSEIVQAASKLESSQTQSSIADAMYENAQVAYDVLSNYAGALATKAGATLNKAIGNAATLFNNAKADMAAAITAYNDVTTGLGSGTGTGQSYSQPSYTSTSYYGTTPGTSSTPSAGQAEHPVSVTVVIPGLNDGTGADNDNSDIINWLTKNIGLAPSQASVDSILAGLPQLSTPENPDCPLCDKVKELTVNSNGFGLPTASYGPVGQFADLFNTSEQCPTLTYKNYDVGPTICNYWNTHSIRQILGWMLTVMAFGKVMYDLLTLGSKDD